MDINTINNLTVNAFGSGLAALGFLVVTINLYGSQGFGRELHVRYIIYMVAVCVAMLSNVMNIVWSYQGVCTPVWSRLNNICYYTTKIIFTDVAWIRFAMVTPNLPPKARIGIQILSALWYLVLLIVVQIGSGFNYMWCQMLFAIEPGYPLYAFQFLVDIVTTSRFLFVLYSLRWSKKKLNWITLVVDVSVILAILSSLIDSVIAASELVKPVDQINWQRFLMSGSAHFIITGSLYCVMSVYSHLDKSSATTSPSYRTQPSRASVSTLQNKTSEVHTFGT